MSSENFGYSSDIEIFFEDVVECLWDILSRETLLLLLNEFLERIKAEASLSREDVDELHKYLNELKRALVEEDKERLSKEQLDRRRFLNKFRRVKRQLEECISRFRDLADKVEKVHKGCTISNVLVHSTGAVSGILTIVGLALAPVTMGASVVLLATGIGLGAAATVTSVSTSIIEHVNRSSAETEASRMMSSLIKKWKVLLEIFRQWLLDDNGGDEVGGSSGVTTQWMEHLTCCQELFGSRVHQETSEVSMKIQMWRRNRG